MAEVALLSWYSVTYCCAKGCGVPIVLPASVDRSFKADHSRQFYCYDGHSQHSGHVFGCGSFYRFLQAVRMYRRGA